MNRFTTTVWDVIADDDTLLAELGAIMRKQYPLFLSPEQTVKANTYQLEQQMVAEVTKWYEWLPATPINALGGELVMDVLQDVEWYLIAALVLANAEQEAAVLSQEDASTRHPRRV
jgi:hypothetical protein